MKLGARRISKWLHWIQSFSTLSHFRLVIYIINTFYFLFPLFFQDYKYKVPLNISLLYFAGREFIVYSIWLWLYVRDKPILFSVSFGKKNTCKTSVVLGVCQECTPVQISGTLGVCLNYEWRDVVFANIRRCNHGPFVIRWELSSINVRVQTSLSGTKGFRDYFGQNSRYRNF